MFDDDDVGLLSGDKTVVMIKSTSSSSSSSDSPASRHLSTTDTPPSLHHHSASSTSQRLNHSTAVPSHYEDLACFGADWLPSNADDVTWATVDESGAHLTLAQSGMLAYLVYLDRLV